jgi:hypothetical protein
MGPIGSKETLLYPKCTFYSMREKVKILKIRKRENGYFVRIPSEVVRELNLEDKEKVEVYIDRKNGEIIYKPF